MEKTLRYVMRKRKQEPDSTVLCFVWFCLKGYTHRCTAMNGMKNCWRAYKELLVTFASGEVSELELGIYLSLYRYILLCFLNFYLVYEFIFNKIFE